MDDVEAKGEIDNNEIFKLFAILLIKKILREIVIYLNGDGKKSKVIFRQW